MFANAGIRREERYGATADSRYGTVSIINEEIAFVEELCGGFYTGYHLLTLPFPMTDDPEKVSKDILEALALHR